MIYNVAQIHEELLRINDSSELFLSDKELHFVVMGLLGMGLLLVIYPLFLILSKHNVLTIAWIYVFTVMVVISFAIEIGQGFTGTGNMDMDDIISGLAGFMLMFFIFAAVRLVLMLIWRFIFPRD
jgi:glycopeptide antibiotics resistance protein